MLKISGGTLITAIPCKDGLAVSADKREIRYDLNKVRDDVVKIHELGPFAAFGITGAAFFYNKRTGELAYDVGAIVKSFYSKVDTKLISQTWDDLKRYLENHFKDFLSSQTPGREPEPLDTYWFYRLPFWYLTEAGKLGSTEMKMRYVKKPRLVECFPCETSQERFQSAEAFAYGHKTVLLELKAGSDSRFNEYRADHTIMRFLKESTLAKDVDTEEALAASQKLITITSRTIHLLEPQNIQIGSTSDSILIHKKKGINPL